MGALLLFQLESLPLDQFSLLLELLNLILPLLALGFRQLYLRIKLLFGVDDSLRRFRALLLNFLFVFRFDIVFLGHLVVSLLLHRLVVLGGVCLAEGFNSIGLLFVLG